GGGGGSGSFAGYGVFGLTMIPLTNETEVVRDVFFPIATVNISPITNEGEIDGVMLLDITFHTWVSTTVGSAFELYSAGGGGFGGGSGFTFGIRASGQTYRQCLSANTSNYSLNTFAGTDNFFLGNDVGEILFGDTKEGTTGLIVGHGGAESLEAGVGEVMTAGRRTASITSMNIPGKTGPATRILAKTGAEKLAGWLTGVAELKLAADVGLTGAEAIGCLVAR